VTKILLNGQTVEADPKKPLIAACHEHGANVPHYCYHPGLKAVGSCRICQVEVKQGEMPARVVAACRTPVAEGMIVNTEAAKAHDARRECLEFLLKNHPLDCPICDKAGECDLQDYSFQEGQGEGRSAEPRRKLEKRKSLGDVIVLDEERCILCSRCVRFMEEVPKTPQLTIAGLGSRSTVATFMDRALYGNYQGNLADVCPVGALTLKKFRFQARVWNLKKSLSTCAECSRGCSITAEVLRSKDLKRFRPRFNEKVNKWWMCDTGRFALERHAEVDGGPARIAGALERGQGADTLDPISSEQGIDSIADMLVAHERRVVIGTPFLTQEEAALVARIALQLGTTPVFVSPTTDGLADKLLHTGDPCPNRRGLAELGFSAAEAAECGARLHGAEVALVVGERAAELLGAQLKALDTGKRVALLDTHVFDAPAVKVCVGVPSHIEKSGTWINVDGHSGRLSIARRAPPGTRALTSSLEQLEQRLSAVAASAPEVGRGGGLR
jgi:NADH-quinone oxidoreductase subunit G